jgi:hypothetical protein
MPEYLAPGVYLEEVSFRPKSIEGVSTSVAGFIGPARYGPTSGTPELLTSFGDFTRIYGGIDNLLLAGGPDDGQINYLAHAVRAFFDNGGNKLYVTRVYQPEGDADPPDPDAGKAVLPLDSPSGTILRARFPGRAGEMQIVFAVRPSASTLVQRSGVSELTGVHVGDVVYVGERPGTGNTVDRGLYDVVDDAGTLALNGPIGTGAVPANLAVASLDPARQRVHRILLTVRVQRVGRFEDELVWNDLSPTPRTRDSLTDLFTEDPASRQQYLTIPFEIETDLTSGAEIVSILAGDDVLDAVWLSQLDRTELRLVSPSGTPPGSSDLERAYTLAGASDGQSPPAPAYAGEDDGPEKTGLKTFEDVEEISIVAAPGATSGYQGPDVGRTDAIIQELLIHCQIRMRYRVAVIDSPDGQVLSEVRAFRGKFDSTHAALYYPWITVVDPLDPTGRREIDVPPGGFVSGIYARSDVTHGVFKAPANEVVLGAIDFERQLNKAQQDVLNPLGVNCFRFFEGRGFRLWGARTISSDPDWKYISVRRYFAYLEHSIDRGTQWAVFENNNDALWANVRRTVEDFLFNEWRNGALLGTKPDQAFFVRCDRSTMTQNDLDNGRLICLIGVAVVKPAEFVIFRIGQMTADSRT